MVVWASTNNKGAIWARHESRHWGWGDNFSFIPVSPPRHHQRLARKQAQTQVTTRGTENQVQGMNHQLQNDSCQGMTEGSILSVLFATVSSVPTRTSGRRWPSSWTLKDK